MVGVERNRATPEAGPQLTAESIAEVLHGRHSGPGRWTARCPVHGPDRHPSLSIGEGKDGRVLLLCRSHNCPPEQIVLALGLSMRDLFDGTQLTPAQRADAVRQKTARDKQERQQRAIGRERRDRVFKLQCLCDSLGAKLILRPNDGKLAELFHQVCDRLHEVESELYSSDPQDGPHRMQAPRAIPAAVHAALMDIAQTFDQKEKAACEAA
jgi:hypothetical protein